MIKKTYFAMLLVLISSAFAQTATSHSDEQSSSDDIMNVTMLIDAGLDKNQKFIEREAAKLSPADRQIIYAGREKNNSSLYAGANVVVGIGLGSFIQGDIMGGVTLLVLDISSTTAILSGGMSTKIGFAGLIVSRVFGAVMPFTYTSGYNSKLKNALGLNASDISLVPTYSSAGAMGLAMNMSY